MSGRGFRIVIEGNIGSGKTSLLRHLAATLGFRAREEPIGRWRDCGGADPLGLMYADPRRHSFLFQSLVHMDMVQLHAAPDDAPVQLLERSLFSAQFVFVRNLAQRGYLSPLEVEVLKRRFELDRQMIPEAFRADLYLYLRSSPATVLERIRQRGRAEEASVSLEYLESLHSLHDDWLLRSSPATPNATVRVLDADGDLSALIPQLMDIFAHFGILPTPEPQDEAAQAM